MASIGSYVVHPFLIRLRRQFSNDTVHYIVQTNAGELDRWVQSQIYDPMMAQPRHLVWRAQNDLPGPAVWRLFHDAGETYLPDIATPIKKKLPILVTAEDNIIKLIKKP